jgi:hypothetical protein
MMVPIKDLIKKYGSERALALAMGVHQPQVNRWSKADALVSEQTGDVYIKTKTTKPLGESPRVDGCDNMPAVGMELI